MEDIKEYFNDRDDEHREAVDREIEDEEREQDEVRQQDY